MDSLCADIILEYDASNLIPIKLEDFEDERLIGIKSKRSFSEYCWTCTPFLIEYIIKKCGHNICTYIDADMFFYSNPNHIIEKYVNSSHPVMFVPHNFSNSYKGKEREVGRYCVEFNPFYNNDEGIRILEEWCKLCLESCSLDRDGLRFGDQKYLDNLKEKYNTISVCNDPGMGIAPWNIENYTVENTTIFYNGIVCRPVFYHFQGIEFDNGFVKTKISRKSVVHHRVIAFFYESYIEKIVVKRKWLEHTYKINFSVDYSVRYKKNGIKELLKSIFFSSSIIRKLYFSFSQYIFEY